MKTQSRANSRLVRPGFAATTPTQSIRSVSYTVSNRPGRAIAVPEDQLYYWTTEWQRNEREAAHEIRTGQGVKFSSATDAIKWLMSADV